MIQKQLQTCSSVNVLKYSNIPLADVASRMPTETNALLSSLGDKWTYSVAINDVYFENATAAFRQAGKTAATAPVNVGAGDGDAAADPHSHRRFPGRDRAVGGPRRSGTGSPIGPSAAATSPRG